MVKLKNKFTAAFLIGAMLITIGHTALYADEDEDTTDSDTAAEEDDVAVTSDVPIRTEDDMLEQGELYAENEYFEFWVVDTYIYTVIADVAVLDEDGKQQWGEDGALITQKEEQEKEKQDTLFGIRNKSNGFIWWSSPINATHDPVAKGAQIDNLSSMFTYESGNPVSYTTSTVRTNTREKRGADEYYVSSVSKIDKITNGVKFTLDFKRRGTTVTKVIMEITLDGDSILVNIPSDQIVETNIVDESGSIMLSMSVLNSFGAALEGEDGYIVVPDGSGAIIEFDNKKTNAAMYSGQVYGRDLAVSQKNAPAVNEQVYFPMYGIVRKSETGDNALVAIAEKGDENATVKANVSRQNATAYNAAWFEFNMRTTDYYYIGTRNSELTIYESGDIKTGDIAVRYYLLSDDELTYVDVANTYREYLTVYGGVTDKSKTDSAPYYLTLNGGTVKTHSIAGFPVDLQTSGTTYSQALEIVQTLETSGISELVLTFRDFNTAGIKRQISSSVQYSSLLGGKKGYKSLESSLEQSGFSLYPSLNFMEYFKSGNGYSYLLNSSKQVTKAYASQSKYEYAFGTVDSLQDSWTILSPYYFSEIFDKLIASLQKEEITSVSLEQATSLLYSDFSRKNPYGSTYFNRRDTVQILTEGYQKMTDAGISILAQSANAYALPYVDEITNVPLFSSNYDIFDYDIPLYQIVVHGLIPYSTKPFNSSADSDTLRLLALSTGTPLHYDFIYESPSEFTDSEYKQKFYANYTGWVDKSIREYSLFNDIISDISDKKIVAHTRISVYETQTEFEGGKTIYINTDTGELRVNDKLIDFGDYGLYRRSSYGG